MRKKIRFSRLFSLVGLATILLIAGLFLDLGYATTQCRQVQSWQRQRADIRGQWTAREDARKEAGRLAELFGAPDLPSALEAMRREDPVTFLARHLSECGLERDELGTEGAITSTERLRRSRFFLRARGSYGGSLQFLRQIEGASLPVAVDDLVLQAVPGSAQLELRVHLSVYQPVGGR